MSLYDWQIIEDATTLNVATHLHDPKYGLAHAVENGGSLWWHHLGDRRVFPNAYMRNIIATLRDYAAMKEGGRITEIPPAAYTLHWSDTQPLPKQGDEGFDSGDAA